MRNLKKVLGLVLCLAMMLSIMVVGAGAAFTDQSEIDSKHQEAVDMCSALNIIVGFDNGSFKPNESVTREQMAKMICVLDNGGKEPQLATGSTFSDVAADRWSNKYIEACASRGVVVGIGGGKFAPAGKVTATQAAKMLLVELGYDDDLQQYSGSDWATKVNVDATKKGYYNDLEDIDVNAPLTREHAAQMVWNALQANEVDYTYTLVTNPDGSISSKVTVADKFQDKDGKDGLTLLEDKYGTLDTEDTTGILYSISYKDSKGEYTYEILPGDNAKQGTFVSTFTTENDYTALLGHNVTFVAKAKDDVMGAYASDSTEIVSALWGDIDSDDFAKVGTKDTAVEIDDADYDFDKNAQVWTFGCTDSNSFEGKAADLDDVSLQPYYEFTAIDNDDDGDVDLVIVYVADFYKVTYVGTDYVKAGLYDIEKQSAGAGVAKDTDKAYKYVKYDGIAKDDYVVIAPDKTLKTWGAFELQEEQSGEMTAIKNDTATFDGNSVDVSLIGNVDTTYLSKSYDYYAINGYVVKMAKSSTTDMSDFLLISGLPVNASSGDQQIDVLFYDGTSQTITVKGVYADTDYSGTKDKLTEDDQGMLFTYEVDNGKYKLARIAPADVEDFDAVGGASNEAYAAISGLTQYTTTMNPSEKDKANASVVFSGNGSSSYKFDADAVVFVQDEDGEWSVKTGADMAKITDTSNTTVLFACAEENDNGYSYVTYAVISTDSITSSDWMYGVVTSDVTYSGTKSNGSGSFTLWNGEKEVELTTADRDTAKNVSEEDVIAYTVDSDGKVDTIVDYSTGGKITESSSDATGITAVVAAVVAWDGDENITLVDEENSIIETYVDSDDTVVIFYDFDKGAGDASGSIEIADEADPEATENIVTFNGTKYVCNVLYVANEKSGEPLVLLVVDTAADWNGNH